MAKLALRSVKPDDKPTPEQAWLASYRREQAAVDAIASERVTRQALKPLVMEKMNLWGMTDKMLADELERTRAR